MRVKFDDHIDLCTRISHPKESNLLIISTIRNSIYTVDCVDGLYAKELYNRALIQGYIDVSHLDYSN